MSSNAVRAYGVKTPFLREGDNLIQIVIDSVKHAKEENNSTFNDGDIIAITESALAITQGNFATKDDIAEDIKQKFNGSAGILFPITSRNRFMNVLSGILKGLDKVTIQFSFPQDEMGNSFMSQEEFLSSDLDYNKTYTLEEFRKTYPKETKLLYTGVDYLELYKSLAPEKVEIILSNNPRAILDYQKDILVASIHRRSLDRKLLKEAGAEKIYDLTEILNQKTTNHGYNEEYGLLGCNKAGDNLKLFPRDGQVVVEEIQKRILEETGCNVEVMIYGDGAFKDPVCGIWELADPVVSPFHTLGLKGTPKERKLKDDILSGLSDEEIIKLQSKEVQEFGALGTTPRQITDLVGSLSDLISGSGDRCTPVVVIENYLK